MRALVLGLLVIMMTSGCLPARPGGALEIKQISQSHQLVQRFDQAFISQNNSGEYHIILIADVMPDQNKLSEDDTLSPAASVPVRHLVHLRVLWRPLDSAGAQMSATGNSSIDWYVFTPGVHEGHDLLRYRGSGLATIRPVAGGAVIRLDNAEIHPLLHRGQMVDPMGSSAVAGHVRANQNDHAVSNWLAEIERLSQ